MHGMRLTEASSGVLGEARPRTAPDRMADRVELVATHEAFELDRMSGRRAPGRPGCRADLAVAGQRITLCQFRDQDRGRSSVVDGFEEGPTRRGGTGAGAEGTSFGIQQAFWRDAPLFGSTPIEEVDPPLIEESSRPRRVRPSSRSSLDTIRLEVLRRTDPRTEDTAPPRTACGKATLTTSGVLGPKPPVLARPVGVGKNTGKLEVNTHVSRGRILIGPAVAGPTLLREAEAAGGWNRPKGLEPHPRFDPHSERTPSENKHDRSSSRQSPCATLPPEHRTTRVRSSDRSGLEVDRTRKQIDEHHRHRQRIDRRARAGVKAQPALVDSRQDRYRHPIGRAAPDPGETRPETSIRLRRLPPRRGSRPGGDASTTKMSTECESPTAHHPNAHE